MEKDSLPKLETAGFTNGETRPEPVLWKTKFERFVRKSGIRIKIVDDKKKEGKEAVSRDEAGYRRLMIKTGICAAIAIVILGIASINTPVAETITDTIGEAVNHEFDIDKDIGRLKFVENLNDEVQSVFSPLPDEVVVLPSDGEVITAFGQAGSRGVRFKPVSTQILSIARGTVEHTGAIDGKGYIKVKLDTGEAAYYYNITPSVAVDDIVKPGQAIGSLAGDYLYLELKDGEVYVDPMAYMEKWTAPAEE